MSRKSDYDRRSYDTGSGNGTAYYRGPMFHVAVVGLSGTEKDKGCMGVGKSCLCNRFLRPQADEYNRDHISVLSQPDFSGPIVNNEHWLYWGETRKSTEEGLELTFSVIEQTEFVDDACFQPFRSGKTMEPYHKRAAATKLSSAEKLMYICKNQLGVEKEYEQHYLPDGKFPVDGFVCVFDVSEIQGRSIERQVELTALILNSLIKTKKPVVLVTTKNDEVYEPYVREAEKLVTRREFKGLIPLVETSAHESVNVDLAFWACVQRDWAKGKSKVLSYHEASKRQNNRMEQVNDAYVTLIRSKITDYRTHWNNSYTNLSQSQDFLKYCDMFGQERAQQTFKRHVKKLKDDYVCRKMQMYLRVLPKVLIQMLPDLDSFGGDQSWPAVQHLLQSHPLFDSNFVINEIPWHEMEDSGETRIPFDLLSTPEAEKVYVDHYESLLADEHIRSLRYQFSELLRETSIVPGQSLKEIRDLLCGRECVESLPESELSMIYEEYQHMLQQRAREQLTELFLEQAPLFQPYCSGQMVTHEDVSVISEELAKDERWTAFDLLPQDRSLALIRHLGFINWPIRDHCPSEMCVDFNIENYLNSLANRSPRHPLWTNSAEPENIRIKLVVLGSSGCAENLASVVKALCPNLEQENPRVHYEFQVITGNENMGILSSRLYLNPLESEAYLCVYSSRTSLEFVLKSLEQSLLTDLQYGNPHHTSAASLGLPLALLLANNADTPAKERCFLRDEGINRAQNLQCAFFDVTSNEPHARFKSDELTRALAFLTDSLIRRTDMLHVYPPVAGNNNAIPKGALNPEIRILLSLMCGDPITPGHFLELLLLPNSLPNTAFYPLCKNSFVTDVGFLVAIDEEENPDLDIDISHVPSRFVEFVISSYHSSYKYKEEVIYGHILVYWSKRQASFSNMTALASSTAGSLIPLQILALVENESRPSKLSHELVAKGQQLADDLHAFFRVSTLTPDLGRCISTFLNFALQNKVNVEKGLHITPMTDGQPAAQNSPGSALSNDDCYDPNVDQVFGSIVPMSMQQPPHEVGDTLSDGIYERLPDEQHRKSGGATAAADKPAGAFNDMPLVKPKRTSRSKHLPVYGSELLDTESGEQPSPAPVSHHPGDYFTPLYVNSSTAGGEEHLVKPSQIKQRRRLQNNNYYNLQSYPSADSLDRVYSLESPYTASHSGYHYHNTMFQMPPHYVHRPFVDDSFLESIEPQQLPPRPASSAHVMIPTQPAPPPPPPPPPLPGSHQPPPYSRIAVSPPPAYKIQPYDYDHSSSAHYYGPHATSAGGGGSSFLPSDYPLGTPTGYYTQRKYHYGHHQSNMFRSYSPPFDPYTSEHFGVGDMAMVRPPPDLYRHHSPLVYATTSRSHHSRSSHFHQLNRQSLLNHHYHPLHHPSTLETVSPYAIGTGSRSYRHHKKKKKRHTSKSRSKSHRLAEDEELEDEDEDEEDGEEEEEGEKTKRSLNRPRRRREEKTRKKRFSKEIGEDGDGGGGGEGGSEKRAESEPSSANQEAGDGEEESASSNASADEQPFNAAADKFAVSSGWAYHNSRNNSEKPKANSNSNSPIQKSHFPDQWPPTQPTEEDSLGGDRYKAPGKLDLNRFNNLSNAIGRLSLNSPGLPLGPTRVALHGSHEGDKFDDYSPEQLGLLASTNVQPGRKGKPIKENESDNNSDNSENLTEQVPGLLASASILNNQTRFNSLKASIVSGGGSGGHNKRMQKKRRVVPVAPPRLPSSANSSTAVTPNASNAGKMFLVSGGGGGGGNSSFDDSLHDRLTISDASDLTTTTDSFLSREFDLNPISLEEYRKAAAVAAAAASKRPTISKMYSLQIENDASGSSSGYFEDATTTTVAESTLQENSGDNGKEKSKFLKSKSIGTFSELDSKKSNRKAVKQEKKRLKEEERKSRKEKSKESSSSRNRSCSKTRAESGGSQSHLESYAQSNGNPVPLFIVKCTHFIELEGLDMEGIYRVPGNRAHVDKLIQMFDDDPDIDISELEIAVNAVATALKDFFMKRLPPIFPPDSMTEIANLTKQYTDNGTLNEMKTFLHNLPNSNYSIIHFMILHFVKVVNHSALNSMDSKNLAICWWPTLLQFEFSDMFVFEQVRPHLMNFVQILIDNHEELFTNHSSNASVEDNLTNSADELASL